MKSKKLIILEKILRFMAKAVLSKYKPKVVAITGSVGKTTTKEAVYFSLKEFFFVRKNEKNYNNEIGVPLTIIGARSGSHSVFRWALVFLKWLRIMALPSKYPQILVLEMGADRPGDIKYLCDFVPLDAGVLTNIGISHLEYFKTIKRVAREKSLILKFLPAGGLAVFNADDEQCRKIAENLKSNVLGYGFGNEAKLRASDINFNYEKFIGKNGKELSLPRGINFKLSYDGKIIPIRMTHCVAKPQIYSALAALGVSVYFELNILDVAKKLENFEPYPGRMSLVRGIKDTMIIDDTYNSAPDSVAAALDTLSKINTGRKIAVLGDMLELGELSDEAHRQAGFLAYQAGAEYFIAVGKRMSLAAKEFVRQSADPEKVVQFDRPKDAGLFVQKIMKTGDVLLIKGSQGMRMEKVVEEVMAQPQRKEELLVRQDAEWKQKPFISP